MINIVGNRLWFFIITGILFVVAIASLSIFGLKTGIDFASGSLLTVKFEQTVKPADVEKELPGFGFNGTVELDAQGNMIATINIGASPSAMDIAAAVLGSQDPVDLITLREAIRLLTAVAFGKSSIATGPPVVVTFRDIQDTKDRVAATMTGSKRTVVVKNAT